MRCCLQEEANEDPEVAFANHMRQRDSTERMESVADFVEAGVDEALDEVAEEIASAQFEREVEAEVGNVAEDVGSFVQS
ncbi:MAG: hypothetical protein MHM6MM_008776 [Cercozoa sp. M6MM]